VVQEIYKVQEKEFCLLSKSFLGCRKCYVGYPCHFEGAGSFIWSQKALDRWCRKFIKFREKSQFGYPCHSEGAKSFIWSKKPLIGGAGNL